MKHSLQKVLSFALALVMVLGMIPLTAMADETQQTNAADLSESMDGLSIAYPYNTETVQQTGTPTSRFEALTFESARNEVESAQMILSPDFDVTSFELTMGSLKNEKGNIIPSWAFEVYVQHYVTMSGSGNANYWSETFQMYNPTYSENGYDGTYPDALIPQDAAITAGENKISAGKNGGIWVNLNVQGAAPGTYTGTAILTVNGTDMNIPVSVHIYDVSLPEQVHTKSSVGIWWDMVEDGEGYINRNLADTYFDYLVSKRIMPFDAWSLTRWDEAFADYAATYLAVSPEISSYSLYYTKNEQGSLDIDTLRTTLTTLINKNISLAQSGSDVDLFAKAYLYFGSICDEPRDDAEYRAVNNITAQLDSLKTELAPMLDAYPSLKASFMNLKHLVTGPNPTDKTYADKTTGSFWNKETFIDDDYGSTPLSGDSYVYVPQYQWLHTDSQRALYENEEELWWYGCCHPISPYPTYHINNSLVSARVESWMRYDYGIDGFVYSSVNIWGDYTNSGIQEFDYWNSYVNNGTPGDQILVLPGSDYGVYGPIGTIRIENIREGNEDYEYLWMLENEYGISDISAYTANLYSGVIPDTDASVHYNNRKALLSKLEELSIAKNGATVIAPGNEGFVRGQEIKPSTSLTIELGNTEEVATLSFDYKVVSGTFNISLNPDWDNAFGYFAFDANGKVDAYEGVSVKKLDDGYYRVTFRLSKLTKCNGNPSKNLSFLYIRGAWTDAEGYIDNVTFTLPGENEPGSGRVMIAADVHVSADDTHTQQQLKETLTYAKNNGVDLLIFNGDTVNVGNDADYAALDSVFTEVFGSPEQTNVKFIFNMGNHEFYPTSACAHEETDYALQFTRFANFASKWSDFSAEQGSIYLTEVNGISYVVTAPSDDWTYMDGDKLVYCAALGGYHDNDIALIDSLIAEATANNPGEPVYLLSHHPWGETYGGASYGMPETKVVTAMKAVMEKYPHLVNVTSHTHFSSLHERSFAQDKWTTINTGMHTYGKYVDIETDVNGTALDYVNIDSRRYTGTDAEGKALHGSTHFVWDVNFSEDSFTAQILNMATETVYPYVSYTVPYGITSANKSEKFAYELADRIVPTLTWSAEDVLTVELVKNGSANSLQLTFNDTDQFYATEGYRIKVVNAATGETLKTVLWASRFWAAQEKKDSYEITVDGVTQCSEYKVTVEAIDFYGNYSAAKLEATVQSSGTVETETGLLLQKCNGTNADCSARDYSRIYFGTTPFTSSSDTLTLVVKTDCTSIKLRAVSNVSNDWEGSAVSKDLEDLGDGWKTATWTLSELIGSNDITTMNGFRIDSLVDGMDILMKDILINNQTDWVGEFQSNYHGVVTQQQIEVKTEEEVFRGQQIVSRTDLTIEFGNAEELATLSFDYKLSSGTFNISLNPDWDNAFGYFAFDANGNVDPYDGVTLETLEDGYTRVTFDLNALTKYTGSPSKVLTFLYLRGAWSDATGYIDNVQFTVAGQPEEPAYRGQEINPSTSLTIELGNTEELSTLSFDYKVLSGTFNISLNPDWDNAFGYFAFDANGNVDAYDGVTVETLEDGYYRVTFDLNALTKYSGNPAKTLSFLYIRGAWTDATGYIDNVQYTVYEAPSEPETNRGQEITPSTSLTIELDNVDTLASLSFDYKVTNGTFNISLNPDWDNYFGYFAFDANGNVDAYDGVTVETLEDGYYRVTFDMNALTKYSGNPGKALSFLYIRGAWTDATGYIDNIQFTVAGQPEVPENRGQEFSANTDLTIDLATTGVLGTLSFDYKITSGEAFNIALMPNWDSYYGYFAFIAEGSVDPYNGVTTEVLEDGYIRVTFDMDALTKVSGTPSKFIDFIYIRGAWTTANGYIDNIQWTEGCEHIYETVAKEPTFTEAGGNVHTCSKCGNSYVTEEIPAYTFQVIQWNIALADDIRANFYLDIDSRLEDAFVTVLVDGYGYKYALSELATTDKGYYIVSANAAAAQMTDNISLVVSSGDLSSEEKTYTIRQYAEYILTGNYEDNTKLLVQRMLNYGAAAQSYFAYNTGNMANIGYEMTDVPTIPEAEAGSVASGDVVGIDYYGASLLYESKVGVRFYYTVAGRIEDYTFTDSMGNTYEPVAKGGRYYVEVMNINPDQYDDVIEMLVTDGTTTQSVSYSPMRYISRKFYGSDNADLVNLVARMYQYHKAAETYLGGAESVDVSYSFTGNEANRAGYAEGVVTISNAKAGETYELYWANSTGKLTGYRALGSATLAEGQSNVSFAIAENVMIPAGADRLIVCASGSEEASGTYSLGEKVSAAQLESKFAVMSIPTIPRVSSICSAP